MTSNVMAAWTRSRKLASESTSKLTEAGWLVQDYRDMHITAGLGVATRDFPLLTCKRTGMDRPPVSKLETGRRANATVEMLVHYADAVGMCREVSVIDDRR
jgi:hypothetical protein